MKTVQSLNKVRSMRLVDIGSALVFVLLIGLFASGCNGNHVDREDEQPDSLLIYYYDLDIRVDTVERYIEGISTAYGVAEDSLSIIAFDLDDRLEVDSVYSDGDLLGYQHHQAEVAIEESISPNDSFAISIAYSGIPREAPNPPWQGGFTWAETRDGLPWVGTSNQLDGASLWWPAIDHPSQRPDSFSIDLNVPDPLVGLSNGQLRDIERSDGWSTFRWFVSHPIHTYAVALHVAPYVRHETQHTASDGPARDLVFWSIPEDSVRADVLLGELSEMVTYLEDTVGEYAFWGDKLAVAQSPFLGMEHQTLIAYGGSFGHGGLGYAASFDVLLFHELVHEWFGNAVGVSDWSHLWLSEGIATYLEAMYVRSRDGSDAFEDLVAYFHEQYQGSEITVSEPASAPEIYDRDLYFGGALVLHELENIVGEDRFLELLQSWYEENRYNLVQTSDFLDLIERSASTSECMSWADAVRERLPEVHLLSC